MQQENSPGNNMIPKHRFDEVNERMKSAEQRVQQLEQMFNAQQQRAQQPQQEEDSPFEPHVEKAMQSHFEKWLRPYVQRFDVALGNLVEQNDDVKFRQLYGTEAVEKFSDKIENLRRERQARGQYITREDAYRHIMFEEYGKKVQPQKTEPETPKEPKFDPYRNRMLTPEEIEAEKQNQQQTPVQQQAAPQQEQAPQQGQAPQQDAGLPPQGSFQQEAPMPMPNSNSYGPKIDITSDEKDLEAWADKFSNETF